MNLKSLIITIILSWLISACMTNTPVSAENLQPSEIRDPEIGEIYDELTIQEENMFNCDGASPTTTIQRSLEQEQTTVFEVVVEAGGLIRGTPIPGILEAEIESKLKSALQRYQGVTYRTSVEIPLLTPDGQALRHTITWREKKVKGIIEVLYQDKIAKISFQRIIGFQLEGRTSEPLICDKQISVTEAPDTQPTDELSGSGGGETIQTTSNDYPGWVICWHGRDGYEYLIAYPEDDAKQGINLNINLTNAQGRILELTNDSLKMCYAEGKWYGYPDPSPWFPNTSYLRLLDSSILVCSDSMKSCQGERWELLPEDYFPSLAPTLQAPIANDIHVITYERSP